MVSLYKKIKEEKLLTALVVVIWLFLVLTTVSKTYAYFVRVGIEIDLTYIILRALLIWGILALFAPVFIALAKRFPLDDLSKTNVGLQAFFSLLFVPVHSVLFHLGMAITYMDTAWSWPIFWKSIPLIMSRLGIIGPLSYWLIIGAYYFKKYYEQYRRRQLKKTEMEAELASIRLHVLKIQLQPHFLFNTLHSINSLIYESPEKARRVLVLLKRFLQGSINRVDEQQVPLIDELEFTGTYLEIEKTRFSNRLTINTDIGQETLDALVPSFLLQPLVENAVKHGISKKMQPGIIEITAEKKGDFLRLSVQDNGPGLNSNTNKKGIGLENIKQRLSQLYTNARFELKPSVLGGLKVEIEIPFTNIENKERWYNGT